MFVWVGVVVGGPEKKISVKGERKEKRRGRRRWERLVGDGSPASIANRTSSVNAAGHPHRNSSSDRPFTYLPWPTEPRGSGIIRDKCCIFPSDVR